jgi:hypothetical protein
MCQNPSPPAGWRLDWWINPSALGILHQLHLLHPISGAKPSLGPAHIQAAPRGLERIEGHGGDDVTRVTAPTLLLASHPAKA